MSVSAPSLLRTLGGVLPESMSPARLALTTEALSDIGAELTTIGHTKPQRPGEQGFAIRRLADASRGVETLVLDKHQQGPAEVAGARFARIIGLDHFVPLAVPQAEDGARMLFRPGVELRTLSEIGPRELIQIRADRLAISAPHLDAATRLRVATMELELLQSMDYLLANSDRHRGNVLVNIATGEISFIDQGAIGDGVFWQKFTGGSPIRPKLHPLIQGQNQRTVLSADTVEWLASRLNEGAIADWMASNPQGTFRLKEEGIVARLHHLITHGEFDYSLGNDLRANTYAAAAKRHAF